MTTLADILRGIERGVFPAPDLSVTVVPAPSDRESCVIAFTGHIVVAADVDPPGSPNASRPEISRRPSTRPSSTRSSN